MKTVVYQSFRRTNVAPWVTTCLNSVESWAAASGYEYVFIDDALFDYAPRWYRDKIRDEVHLVADLARLKIAREFLQQGYERTIWVDADVLVFDPQRFVIDLQRQYAFCREVWIHLVGENRVMAREHVNNAVMVFTRDNDFLDFYIEAAQQIVANRDDLKFTAVSTEFLSDLHRHIRFPLLRNVGLFSPFVMHAIVNNVEAVASLYMRQFGSHVHAANLCATFNNSVHEGLAMNDRIYEQAIARLLQTRGDVLNRLLP